MLLSEIERGEEGGEEEGEGHKGHLQHPDESRFATVAVRGVAQTQPLLSTP